MKEIFVFLRNILIPNKNRTILMFDTNSK